MFLQFFGQNPSDKNLERIRKSPNYKKDGFENLTDTPMMVKGTSYFGLLKKVLNKPHDSKPSSILPSVKTDLKNIISDKPYIIWFGHSSYFIRIDNKAFLIDPVFSGHASPVSFMVKSFDGSDIYTTDDLPEIDFLILTHDHYDHLDYETIIKLKTKVKSIYCSLGVSSHLIYWGYEENVINEIDWWQTNKLFENMHLTATPARHFSGRGLVRNKTFWSSFILQTESYNLFLGGDSGYDAHFKEIGEKFGPFDIAILECGQYNSAWPFIHMMPEQTVQAAIDLHSKVLLPVHWGKFSLALHPWNEPIERALAVATLQNLKLTTPLIGEPVVVGERYPDTHWWNS
jgi:L-ascorbate metabolism protein UlaG (beta-lactamase superfamily)